MQTKASIYSDGNPQMVKLFEQAGHPAKVMCVALDYAKAQHTALICNGQGDLLKGAFVVDNTPVGATHLLDQVRQCAQSKKIGPTQVFFGGEDCPYFAENSKIFKIAVLVVRYLQFRSNFRWAVSNLVALLRWNLFSYRNLWEWLNRPFDTPPEPAAQLQLNLDSIRAGG